MRSRISRFHRPVSDQSTHPRQPPSIQATFSASSSMGQRALSVCIPQFYFAMHACFILILFQCRAQIKEELFLMIIMESLPSRNFPVFNPKTESRKRKQRAEIKSSPPAVVLFGCFLLFCFLNPFHPRHSVSSTVVLKSGTTTWSGASPGSASFASGFPTNTKRWRGHFWAAFIAVSIFSGEYAS